MAAKSTLLWTFAGFYTLVLVYLLVVCGQGGGMVEAANEGSVYLDRKESDVKNIATNAEQNQAKCENLNGCNTACTRAACYPLSGSISSTVCTAVDNNEYCGTVDGPCKFMLLDYTTSFVTLPSRGDATKVQQEVARDICLQRVLLPTFKNASSPSEYSYVYFGSASGPFRSYPGRENNCAYPYDTRKRSWYLNGVSVSKEVKILIDVGRFMASEVTPEYGRDPNWTYLNLSQNATLELLQTFSPQDYVEVVSFDSVSAESLGGPVNIDPYDSFDSAGRPELAPLVAKVKNLAASEEVSASNLNAAILKASSSFLSTASLKVIIVMTNGLFAPLNSSTFPSKNLTDHRVKIMVYKLQPNADTDRFLLKTTLRENLCSVNGSFELLDYQETLNPLYALRSYFTYLAHIQLVAVGDRPAWSNKYKSYSTNRSAITVTYPAFGSDEILIGVAGIDVAIDDLNTTLKAAVLLDISNRTKGIITAPANFPMSCDYQIVAAQKSCADSPTQVDEAVCKRNDTRSTLKERTCCGSCALGDSGETGVKPWKIALAVIGVVVGVALIGTGITVAVRRHGKGGSGAEDPMNHPPP